MFLGVFYFGNRFRRYFRLFPRTFAVEVGEEQQDSRGIFARCEKALPFFISIET